MKPGGKLYASLQRNGIADVVLSQYFCKNSGEVRGKKIPDFCEQFIIDGHNYRTYAKYLSNPLFFVLFVPMPSARFANVVHYSVTCA